jgi:hypothetical protein
MAIRRIAAFVLLLAVPAAFGGQSGNLIDLADRLANEAEQLAEGSYDGFDNRDRGNRSDVEALYLVHRFSSAAGLFRRMVRDRRPEFELRIAHVFVSEQLRALDRYAFERQQRREMSRILDEIGREIGGGGRHDEPERRDRISGRMRWQGTVDHEILLRVRESDVQAVTVAGNSASNTHFTFTSPLPRRNVDVDVQRLEGRGTIEVIQQPSRDNNYTAVIRLVDSKGGSDKYEFELVW